MNKVKKRCGSCMWRTAAMAITMDSLWERKRKIAGKLRGIIRYTCLKRASRDERETVGR